MANFTQSPTYGGSLNQAMPGPVLQPPIEPQQNSQASASAASFQQHATIPPEQLHAMAQNPQFAAALWNHLQASGFSGLFPPLPTPANGYTTQPSVAPLPANPVTALPQTIPRRNDPSPHTIQSSSHPQAAPVQPLQNRIAELVDADKEEGEVSEGEYSSYGLFQESRPTSYQSHTFASLRGAESSSSAAQLPPEIIRTSYPTQAQSGAQNASMSTVPSNPVGNKVEMDRRDTEYASMKESVRGFVMVLNQHGYGFSNVANEGVNRHKLDQLYRNLGIPTPTNPSAAVENVDLPNTSSQALSNKQTSLSDPQTKEAVQPEASANPKLTASAPSSGSASNRVAITKPAPQPVDRQEYVARLMAARSAKSNSSSKPAEVTRQPAKTVAVSKAIPTGPKAAAASKPTQSKLSVSGKSAKKANQQPQLTEAEKQREEQAAQQAAERKRLQTELARKRLEMLAAAKANKSAQNAVKTQEAQKPETQAPVIPPTRSPKSDSSFYDESGAEGRHAHPKSRLVSSSGDGSSSVPLASPGKAATIAMDVKSAPAGPDSNIAGTIPGLVLNNNPMLATSGSERTQEINQADAGNIRKRPVAADFDMEIPQQAQQPKRLFGQRRLDHEQETVVIEVSEDESDAMDIDDDKDDVPQNLTGLPSRPDNGRHSSFKDMPPLTNFPPRTGFPRVSSLPRSALNTPPMINTPSSGAGTHMLGAKEKEILELKRKIAEMEQKAAAKRRINTPNTSKATTPPTTLAGETSNDLGHQNSFNGSHAIVEQAQVLIDQAKSAVGDGLSPSLVADNLSNAPENPVEWKRRRRAEIQTELPLLKATLALHKARMEELKQEIAVLEVDSKKQLEDKERLIQELESLGIDTDGMPDEELQAKRDENSERLGQQTIVEDVLLEGARSSTLVEITEPAMLDAPLAIDEAAVAHSSDLPEQPEIVVSVESAESAENAESSESSEACEDEMDFSPYGSDASDAEDSNGVDVIQTSNMLDAPIPDVGRSLLPSFSGETTPQVDHDDFYSPAPVERVEEQGKLDDGGQDSLSEQNQVAEHRDASSDGERSSDGLSAVFEGPDNYTSPEADKVADDDVDDSESEEGEPEDEANYEPFDMELEVSVRDHSASLQESLQSPRQSPDEHHPDTLSANSQELVVADDATPQLQDQSSSKVDMKGTAKPADVGNPADSTTAFFKPYESPLRMFKAYRYHPNYADDVSGGFRSLTFSHQIHPDAQICRYEAAGGVCNDDECPDQHFKKMGLSDDMILVQLGTSNPGQTEEEKQKWNAGLREVLNDLREKNTKDPEAVATAIAKYRREFLQDSTRVLSI